MKSMQEKLQMDEARAFSITFKHDAQALRQTGREACCTWPGFTIDCRLFPKSLGLGIRERSNFALAKLSNEILKPGD